MKHLRKRLLTLLALTLFGGAGAWAQGPTTVIEITTDMLPASWENDNSDVTLADLQALGFGDVDVSVAQAWTGAPQAFALLFYGFNGGNLNFIAFDGGNPLTPNYSGYSKSGFYSQVLNNPCFITGSQEIELTKSGANQWSLGQTPDYDLELQVEYYEAYALKNIPAGWQVMVNGVDKTSAIAGDSLLITETDSVTLVPDNPRRVKSVTLVEEGPAVQTITIGGVTSTTLDITGCTTWQQIVDRNPGVIQTDGSFVFDMYGTSFLTVGGSGVSPISTYNSSLDYEWMSW